MSKTAVAPNEININSEELDSQPIDQDNIIPWVPNLIKDQADYYYDHIIHESSKVWSFSSTLGFNNTSQARHDLSIQSGYSGRFMLLLKKYQVEKDRETLKQLKTIKKLILNELDSQVFDIRNMGVLSSVLGCVQALFIYKELTNDLGVDKIKLQAKLSALFKEVLDPANSDQLSVEYYQGITGFLYVINQLVVNEIATTNFVVDLLKQVKIIQEIYKKVSIKNRTYFRTILKANSCERNIFYFDLNQLRNHPSSNTQFEIITQIIVSFTVMNKYSQQIDTEIKDLTFNTAMFMLEVLNIGSKDALEGKLITLSTYKTIGQVSFLINVKKYYQKDTSDLINKQCYYLISNGASLKGNRIYDGTLKNVLVLLNVQKHTRSSKIQDQALKMMSTVENKNQKNMVASRTKLPSLTDRPQGLYEGELGLLWVLYEFISIERKESEAKAKQTYVVQDKLFCGFPAFDIFI